MSTKILQFVPLLVVVMIFALVIAAIRRLRGRPPLQVDPAIFS